MTTPNRNESPALKALMRHPQICAVVWMTRKGKVKAKRGQAMALRIGADDPTVQLSVDSIAASPKEALYVTNFADDDYLVVIFEDEADFETIKQDVEDTLKDIDPE